MGLKCISAFHYMNSLPNNKMLDLPKLKVFADDKLNVAKNDGLCDRLENIARKVENAGYQHFLLFPQCFLTG